MKDKYVYIILYGYAYEEGFIFGVYSSENKATKEMKDFVEESDNGYDYYEIKKFEIKKFEIKQKLPYMKNNKHIG